MTGMGGSSSASDPHSSLAARTSRRPLERQPERAEIPFPSPTAAAASSSASPPAATAAAAGSYAGAAGAAGNDSKPLGSEEEARQTHAETVTVAEEARAFAERERRLAEKRQDEVCMYVAYMHNTYLCVGFGSVSGFLRPGVCSTSNSIQHSLAAGTCSWRRFAC